MVGLSFSSFLFFITFALISIPSPAFVLDSALLGKGSLPSNPHLVQSSRREKLLQHEASFSQRNLSESASPHKETSLCVISYDSSLPDLSVLAIVSVALVIGVAAQGFINSMISGDRGLGAFISDGSGYKKSNFKARDKKSMKGASDAPLSGGDPLSWLKFPMISFVEVAGQEDDVFAIPSPPSTLSLSSEVIQRNLESLAERYGFILRTGT